MKNIIEVDHMSFWHEDKKIFNNASFSIQENQKVFLIGENGAGKSTLLNILTGRLKPQKGTVTVNSKMTYHPQQMPFFENMSVIENIQSIAMLLGIPITTWQIQARLKDFGIEQMQKTSICKLSGGERQRLGLVLTLLRERPLILLDEADSAMDPSGRTIYHSVLNDLKKQKKSLLWISHHTSEGITAADTLLCIKNQSIITLNPEQIPKDVLNYNDEALMKFLTQMEETPCYS